MTFDLADGKIASVRAIAAPTRLVRLTEAWRQHGPDTALITQWCPADRGQAPYPRFIGGH